MKRFFLLLTLALAVACKPGEQVRELFPGSGW